MNYKISHPTKIINCEINLPSSKSISNRLLIIRELCEKKFTIENLSESEDTQLLDNALNKKNNIINVNHAGTSFRFLTAFLALQKDRKFILNGSNRLKKRPIKQLVKALQKIGAKIQYLDKEGFAPLKIIGAELKGGSTEIDGKISSQFISAILLVAPLLRDGIKLKINGKIVSKSYIETTLNIMTYFGIKWSWTNNVISIQRQNYIPINYKVESDWSCASFWFQIASLSKKCHIKMNGLKENSIQADKNASEIFKSLGVTSYFKDGSLILTKNDNNYFKKEINLINNPDLYQPLKCTLFAKRIETKFSGLETLKDKETDRITAVNNEITKLDSTKIIETYADHRMAMSFASLAIIFDDIQINNIEVVTKSYPKFWQDLQKGGFKISPLIG